MQWDVEGWRSPIYSWSTTAFTNLFVASKASRSTGTQSSRTRRSQCYSCRTLQFTAKISDNSAHWYGFKQQLLHKNTNVCAVAQATDQRLSNYAWAERSSLHGRQRKDKRNAKKMLYLEDYLECTIHMYKYTCCSIDVGEICNSPGVMVVDFSHTRWRWQALQGVAM